MERVWTESQRAAFSTFGGKIVVSAGAGSGKTSVLVERAVALMTVREVPADRLLIITFTNAAADELKNRLYARIDAAAAGGGSFLRRQAVLVRRAHVGTFDSFCKKLVFEHFGELDIPPDFNVATGAFAESMRRSALEGTLEDMYEDSDFKLLSGMFGQSRSDEQVAELINSLDYYMNKLGDPEAYERLCISDLEGDGGLDSSVFGRFLLEKAAEKARYLAVIASRSEQLCGADEVLHEKYLPVFVELSGIASRLEARIAEGYDAGAAYAAAVTVPRMPPLSKSYDSEEKTALKAAKARCGELIKEIKDDCFFTLSRDYRNECTAMLPAIKALFRARLLYQDRLTELKKRRKAYEFSDISRAALSLLVAGGEPTALANELSHTYAEVMVDEYQDTDEIQSALYNAISGGGSRLFMVGDAKQSIYRFRRAEPRIMLRERDLAHDRAEGVFPMHIKLLENFRSGGNVINAVNSVFDVIMRRGTGGIDYKQERMAAGSAESAGESGIELRVITGGADMEQQARFAARKIKQLMAEDDQLLFSDFAVLSSKLKGRSEEYERVFREEGVPLFTDAALTVYTTEEGEQLASVMAAVDNPLDDIGMAALLTSPAIGFGADELFELRQSGRGNLYPLLLESGLECCARARSLISELMFLKIRLPVDELIEETVKLLRLDELALSRPGGEYRLSNIYAFVEEARTAFESTGCTLADFLRVAARAAESGASERRTPPDGTVVFKTIHTSKGLEWKYVFVVHCEYTFRSETSPLLFDSDLGMGARITVRDDTGAYKTKTAAHGALSMLINDKSVAESERLLYVALTRARKRTWAVASDQKFKENVQRISPLAGPLFDIDRSVMECRSFYEWLLLSAAANGFARRLALVDEGENAALGAISVAVEGPLPEVGAPESENAGTANEEVSRELRQRISFSRSDAWRSLIPSKLSVTSLTKQPGEQTVAQPAFALSGGLSAAGRGTALHLFMQYADYKKAKQDPLAELDRLVEKRFIDESYAGEVDIDRIKAALDSPFFEKILSADRLLREYEFFLPVDSGELGFNSGGRVMIQGVADCIAVTGKSAIIVDYKSDRAVTQEQLSERYSQQLKWYSRAAARSLALEISGCYIYSFTLGHEVKVV